MGIDERIPDFSDQELQRLHANAVRLADSGTQTQRQQAERLLPLLGAALEERRLARVAAQTARRRTNAKHKTVEGAGEGVKESAK